VCAPVRASYARVVRDLVGVVQFGATAAMGGLIWFVQVVHYPLFAAVDRSAFEAYEQRHRWLTGFVVGPLMAVETLTALAAVLLTSGATRWWAIVGVVMLALIHASTVTIQVPLHVALSNGFDPVLHRRLVRSNWLRTVLWTARLAPAAIILTR